MNPSNRMYRITIDGEEYTGTAEEVARWYCERKGITLYVEPEIYGDAGYKLYADIPDFDRHRKISRFEVDVPYMDEWYRLFFRNYMQVHEDESCSLKEISVSAVSGRDSALEIAGGLACAMVMRSDPQTVSIPTVLQLVREIYAKLLELMRD